MTSISESFFNHLTPHQGRPAPEEVTLPPHMAALEISNLLLDPGLATNRFGIKEFHESESTACAVAFARLGGVLALLELAPDSSGKNRADPNAVEQTAEFIKDIIVRSNSLGHVHEQTEHRNEVLERFTQIVQDAGKGSLWYRKHDTIGREAPVISRTHEMIADRTTQRADRRGITIARTILSNNYPRAFKGLVDKHFREMTVKLPTPRVSK